MFENPRRGRQARNFTKNVSKILDLKSSSEQIFSENCRWVPLYTVLQAEMILERYPEAYSNQFTTAKSPFQSVQCSTVLNNKKTINL